MTGGGSGGHITPILAVAHELKQQRPDAEIIYIGQKGDKLSDIPAGDPSIDVTYDVWAGKLRRYADEDWRQWLNVRTQSLNVRDASRLARGVGQSYRLLKKLKPDVIFTRGGFVSVPVAIGGYLNHIPYITHDSDSVPSLANRLIAPRAAIHAVALPKELYPYQKSKTIEVGVPVSEKYVSVTTVLREAYRKQIGISNDAQLLFVTGGGNGARMLNEAVIANARYLLKMFPRLHIVHVAGRTLESETTQGYAELSLGRSGERVHVYGYINGMAAYSGAADIVVTRGGATTLAEFAIQGVACLVVPSKQLSWNVKNAQILAKEGAALVLTEEQTEQPERLGRTLGEILADDTKRTGLASKIGAYAHPQAAAELAELILNVAGGKAHAWTEN